MCCIIMIHNNVTASHRLTKTLQSFTPIPLILPLGNPPAAGMNTVHSSVPVQRLIGLLALLRTRFDATYDRARTILFFYVLIKYGFKSLRHLRARGTLETFREGWGWLSGVRCHILSIVTHPLMSTRFIADLAVIIDPAACGVKGRTSDGQSQERHREQTRSVRYLTLPPEGQSKDWILAEMGRVDGCCHSFDDRGAKLHDWKDGKIGGAVYREWFHF